MVRRSFNVLWTLFLCICLLTGCAVRKAEVNTNDDIEHDWVQIGPDLGVENPKEGDFVFASSAESLNETENCYAATWKSGNSQVYTDSSQEMTEYYTAILQVSLQMCADDEAAHDQMLAWQQETQDAYGIMHTETCNVQDVLYTIDSYAIMDASSPYAYGVSAFGRYNASAIQVQILCTREFQGDAERILESFLEGFHYGQ